MEDLKMADEVTLEGKSLAEVQKEKAEEAVKIADQPPSVERKQLKEEHYNKLAGLYLKLVNLQRMQQHVEKEMNDFGSQITPEYFPGESDSEINLDAAFIQKKSKK